MTTMMNTTTTSSSNKPPPRPTPLSVHYRNLPPEPCSPGNDIQLSKSLGDAFRFGRAMMPLHRQISEVSSITHSGYLYKRSNRPYQQVSSFPLLDSLEITVNSTQHGTLEGATSAIEAELTPNLHPKPTSMEDAFSRDHHLVDDLNHHHHHHQQQHHQQYTWYENGSGSYRRPLHFSSSILPPDPTSTSLAARFEEDKHNNIINNNHTNNINDHYNFRNLDNMPLAPLLTPPAPEITESISTKATEPEQEYSDEFPSATTLLLLLSTTTTESQAMQEKKRQLALLEQSLNCAAAFFGIHVESAFPPPLRTTAAASPERAPLSAPMTSSSTSNKNVLVGVEPSDTDVEAMSTKTSTTTTKPPTKSVPIKVNNNIKSNAKRELVDGSFDRHAHRRCSAPGSYDNNSVANEDGTLTSSHRSRPADYVDPKDHHLWRAKYCVLEDGVLYFYRSKEDAETQEAKQERHCSAPLTNDAFHGGSAAAAVREGAADLSKSPMASRACLVIPSVDGSLSGSNSDAESSFMWEKRVALNCVGAVRSAETEYGKNAFELLAVDDEEDDGYTNKLVLKAPKQGDMNEWIFQFHRSLASFVMNMVDLVGSSSPSPSYALGDIHHPSFEVGGMTHSIQTPLRSFNVPAFSPRFLKHMPGPPITASLSHGHGRSQRRRRKADLANKGGFSTDSVHSVASTPTAHSPTQMPFPLAICLGAQSNLITPLKHGDLTPSEQEDVSRPFQTQQRLLMEDKSPELSAPQSANPPETERPPPPPAPAGGKYIPPHLRKQATGGSAKYVPPHLRNKEMTNNNSEAKSPPRKYVPPHLRNKGSEPNENGTAKNNIIAPRSLSLDEREIAESSFCSAAARDSTTSNQDERPKSEVTVVQLEAAFKLGGCADPLVIGGSILDQQYIEKRASKVGPVRTDAYGSLGGSQGPSSENINTDGIGDISWSSSLEWEIGAVSECGIRESNEDAYFVTNDLVQTFSGLIEGGLSPTYWDSALGHRSGVFAIFDGHCGNQAARFAAERLPHFLYGESLLEGDSRKIGPEMTEGILRRAITKLDEEFCRICVQDGREWESGSTALIATIVEEHLVIGNIGDCRGVLCRIFDNGKPLSNLEGQNWTEVVVDHAGAKGKRCFWRDVAEVHSPSRPDERGRIERAGGWTTTETEIPISQLQRMDFLDQDVIDILRRCFQDRINDSQGSKTCSSAPQRILQISRVCGELAVSRAIGDRDFKAACNMPLSSDTESGAWETSLLLPYPDEHNRQFVGDLVSNKPDFQAIRVGEADLKGEFLLLACDGLWDVMDKDDAVRVTWDLLFEKNCPAKQAAARLAELAIHLGSSDNITVIVVRFFPKGTKS